MATPGNLSEQILALPSGAGSVASAGQTFEVRAYTGTGSYAIPIETRPGHAGIGPALALNYSTHGGSGIAGLGWSLGLAAVERRLDKGLPAYDDGQDAFTLQGDELLDVGGGQYRLRIESRFARVRHVQAYGRDFWVVTERDGTRVFYGWEADHRLHDDAGRIAAWYASRKQDVNGNEVAYTYTRDATSRDVRLQSVEWGGCYRVAFSYEQRPDPIRSFRPGFEHVRQDRLARIELQVRAGGDAAHSTYRSYDLDYITSASSGRSLLAGVRLAGIDADGQRRELPPLTFAYTQADLAQRRWHTIAGPLPGASLRSRNVTLVRQSGGGLPDILETTATGHWLRENLGDARYAPPRRVSAPAQTMLEDAGTFISDMDGDGWGDLVVNGGRRVYRGVAGGGWALPYASAAAPSLDLEAPDVRLADLDADGMPDALYAGAGGWTCFRNLGQGRWAAGVTVPSAPSVRLDDPRVHLADIKGDGLPDLVYVDRRRILVWPGMGLGRFGAPYELGNAPDLGAAFDPKYVRWSDLTGSGQGDLVYVRNGSVTVCLNRAGLALADAVTVSTRRQSAEGHVEPVDLLGGGAQGLLLSDRPTQRGGWSYLDLFPAGRPDLLAAIDNGLGAATSIAYGSSAVDWARDRSVGQGWHSALPSPQIVVAALMVVDSVTGNRLGTNYRYHHGVYDGEEREFRGFAMVEQTDREADADDPAPQPPALFRRWYHTGFDLDLRDSYTALPEGALEDDVPRLPWAQRSLRGQTVREETFALDGDPRPYLVQETAYRVFPIQQCIDGIRYSFAPLAVRSRVSVTERGDERRIAETITTYDRHRGQGYGLPVEVREKGWGRRGEFASAHEIDQTRDLERFAVTTYFNRDEPDGDYLAPYVPAYLVCMPALVERYGVAGSDVQLLGRERSYYDGDSYKGLGYPGTGTSPGLTRGLLSSRLVLALTEELRATSCPADSLARSSFDAAGAYLADGADHYAHAERRRYDSRGMITGILDARGGEAGVEYDDAYGLFPVRTTDAAGHPTVLLRGRLPFQVVASLDANGNTTGYAYDPSGLPSSLSVQGKFIDGQWSGDPPSHPTETYAYDFSAAPMTIRVERRQQRMGAVSGVTRFVDGFGRAIQERHDAEPDPVTGAPRYRVSGWQVFNHKGLVVKAFQPVFSDSAGYRPGDAGTAFVATDYDPLGRPTRIAYPDGSFESTVYHPWVQSFSDRNDNAAAITAADPRYGRYRSRFQSHLNTPKLGFVDALGRTIAQAADNGTEVHVTRKRLDLRDQVVEVWDARGLGVATWTFQYDFLGKVVRSMHASALGERFALFDSAGNLIWSRDARGIETMRSFDALNRPLEERSAEEGVDRLRRRWRYIAYDEAADDFAASQSRNLFGRVEEERDADGLRYFDYDWRGLTTRTTHRFWSLMDQTGKSWDSADSELWTLGAGWDPQVPDADRDRIAAFLNLPDLSDGASMAISTEYDAAGRITQARYPEGMAVRRSYNPAGLLERIDVDRGAGEGMQPVIDAAGYDERGQLTYLRHGNGVETTRDYDEALGRLTRISSRQAGDGGRALEDRRYGYDPVGNPMEIVDALTGTSFADNQIVPNTRSFTYDPRYRLVRATGRKHRSVRRKDDYVLVPSPDPNAYAPYTILYDYDATGNFRRNQEYSSGALQYKTDRIDLFNGDAGEAGSFADASSGNFRYDANGNATHTPRHDSLAYTYDNQVRHVDLKGGGQVHYLRHGDQRVVRLVKKNGVSALTIYLGPFEYHLRTAVTGYTKLVMQIEGQGRNAQVERILAGADPDSLALFFHHADHLGCAHLLSKDDGNLLSQEEFFPYGNTSDRRDARNRYRFIGVEQDDDTRLYMTGPRTYDGVSGRFLQPDPLSAGRPEQSPYLYARCRPLGRLDDNGYADLPPDKPPPSGGTPKKPKGLDTMSLAPDTSSFDISGDLHEFTLTPDDIEEYLQHSWTPGEMTEIARAEAAINISAQDNPLYRGEVLAAERAGRDTAFEYTNAVAMREYAEKVGNQELASAAEEIITDARRATEIRMAAAASGRAIARAGLQAAADSGLQFAVQALADLAAPGAGALVGAASDIEGLTSGGGGGAIYMLPFMDIRCNDNPRPPPPPPPDPPTAVDIELKRLEAQQAARPPSETTPPLYKGPCEICHW